MGTDDIFKNRKGMRRKRKESNIVRKPYRYLIICEGLKTEPNYFRGIKQGIDIKYKEYIDVFDRIEIDIDGTGRNTQDLVNYAIKKRSLSDIPYGHTWVIFDKDEFTDEQFNNAIKQAIDNDIKVGWSNESIELWFLLHFEFMNTAINRHQYIEKLNEHFKKLGINKGKYKKNMNNIFEILMNKGSISNAIYWSKKLAESYKCESVFPESKMNPCTVIYELVEELLEYL